MAEQLREILLLSRAERALVEANTVDEARGLRDKAAAIAVYAKKAKLGRQMAAEAAALRLRAERRMGQLLQDTLLAKAAPGNQYTGPVELERQQDTAVTLHQLGITKSDSSRTQRIASVDQHVFEEYLTGRLAAHREPSAAGLFRHAGLGQSSTQSSKDLTANSVHVEFNPRLLPTGSLFAAGYVEAPWETEDRPASMSVDDACRLPVGEIFEREAHLHFWCRPQGLLAALDVMEAWGFQYRDFLVCPWPPTANSQYWNTPHALVLLGVRGNLPFRKAAVECPDAHSCEKAENRRHNLMQLIEQVSPGPYAHVFGPPNAAKAGWTSC
jgi:hypothetical protein